MSGCLSFVSENDDQSRGGATVGSGFSTDGFGSDATAPMVRYDAMNTGATSTAVGPQTPPTQQWVTDQTLGSPIRPTILGENIFTNSINGVCAFTIDGERRWAYDTNRSDLNPAPVSVVRDRVYATRTTAVFALDAKTGAERWIFTPPVATNRCTAPAVTGDTVYVVGQHPDQAATLWAIATLDGSVRWQVKLGGETASPPVIAGEQVYCVTTGGGLYAVDTTTETISWQRSITPTVGPPAASTDGVFVATTNGIIVYNHDGTQRWRTPEMTAPSGLHDGLVLNETMLYTVGSENDSIVALATDTGDEQWEASLSGDVRSPVVAADTLYGQDTTGEIHALSPMNGSRKWTTRLDLRSMTGITVANSGLVVGADDQLLRYE